MKGYKETAVGVFVLIGLLCVGYLTVKLGRMELLSDEGYRVIARFSSVTGLRVGADVEIAGVPVGKVFSIELAADSSAAVVVLRLRQDMRLADDTIAAIKTSGLIGDKYVNLVPGGSPDMIAPGGEIGETQSVIDIESLIGKFAFGGVK
ncbi:MAG: outer membrane lipid asymmetry maintenance protein MlaD [Deltaproteobacteria bacterium]|jgi:phospholipid/cholesterol/gamma-HCH transport system substrate-binding protein|nr:outer membrane lipid asymmetry maintenance protein MlaD [Deltaproteobacteria bacterium]